MVVGGVLALGPGAGPVCLWRIPSSLSPFLSAGLSAVFFAETNHTPLRWAGVGVIVVGVFPAGEDMTHANAVLWAPPHRNSDRRCWAALAQAMGCPSAGFRLGDIAT